MYVYVCPPGHTEAYLDWLDLAKLSCSYRRLPWESWWLKSIKVYSLLVAYVHLRSVVTVLNIFLPPGIRLTELPFSYMLQIMVEEENESRVKRALVFNAPLERIRHAST